MADWKKEVVDFLVKLFKKDPKLTRDIYLAIKKIENKHIVTENYNRQVFEYIDRSYRFKIKYIIKEKITILNVTIL